MAAAELSTPSAAEMATAGEHTPTTSAGKDKQAPTPAATGSGRPERPDEEAYKEELAKAEKELRAAEERLKAIKSRLDLARPPKDKETPTSQRQVALRSELASIRAQQQGNKTSRGSVLEKIKRLDENLKVRIAEQKTARSRTPFKSVEEVQGQIDTLQRSVDAGTMKIVDEKKALGEISQLNRQKRGFAGFEEAQKAIDDVKAQIAELKKGLEDPESRALSERYTTIAAELDAIKASQDDAFKSLNSLRDERTKVHEEQQKKYAAVKEIKDRYYHARRAAADYEKEARRIRDAKRREENDAYHRGRRQEAAKAKLDDASAPAYQDEIRICGNLIAYFDPSSAAKADVAGPGKFAASATRTVDTSGFKGTKYVKKGDEEDSYFIGSGGKKGRKGRGAAAAAAANGTSAPASIPVSEGKFSLDMGTIDSLGRIGVDPPMSQADVPNVVEKLKGKLEFWKGDQKRKTDENIANAQKEIDRLEAESTAADAKISASGSSRAATTSQNVNGAATAAAGASEEQEKAEVAQLAQGLEKTNIDDSTEPAAAT